MEHKRMVVGASQWPCLVELALDSAASLGIGDDFRCEGIRSLAVLLLIRGLIVVVEVGHPGRL